MSTILKALRKLEGEKGEDSALPALDAKVLVAPGEPLPRPRRPSGWLRLAGLGALVLALLAGGWWLLSRRPGGSVAAPGISPAGVARTAPRAASPPVHPAPPPAAPPISRTAAAEAAPRPPAAAPAAPAPPARIPAPPPQALAASPPPEAPHAARPPSPPPAAPAAREAAPRSESRVARRESPRRPRAATRRSAVPEVAVIPPPPSIQVEEIIWHPDPQRRVATVRVEGRDQPLELHEGDAVGTLVVAEIDPGAVIFLDGASRVRKPLSDSP